MTYDPTIPAASDILSQSQVDIQTNFSELNSLFNRDHFKWNDATSSFRGYHRQITFPKVRSSAPPATGDTGILFPLADTKDTSLRTQLYFVNQSSSIQVTNRFAAATDPGWIMLNKGIIFIWAFWANTGSGTQNVDFPVIPNLVGASGGGFPNTCLSVTCTAVQNDNTAKPVAIKTGSLSATKFTIKLSDTSIDGIYYFAVGF